jgi:hypothetical protein
MENNISSSNSNSTSDKDQVLWNMARKRAQFKKHFFTYLVINVFLWIIWFMTDGPPGHLAVIMSVRDLVSAWPIWTTIGWGIGLLFNYFGAYQGTQDYMAQKEYDKLIKQNSKM